MTLFDVAFNYLLIDEGEEYSDNPADAGGPTKFGVTLKEYERFIGHIVVAEDMKNLSIEDAKEFYLKLFWNPLMGDQIKFEETAICLFDSAVLYGLGTAVSMAQKIIKDFCQVPLKLDGIMGDMTLGLLNSMSADIFITQYHRYLLQRIDAVITNNPSDEVFRRGWTNRTNRLLTLIHH